MPLDRPTRRLLRDLREFVEDVRLTTIRSYAPSAAERHYLETGILPELGDFDRDGRLDFRQQCRLIERIDAALAKRDA